MNEIKEYLSSVKKRLEIILDLATYLPAKTPFFWGDEVITRLSDQDRETFKSYLSAARQNQENVTECKKTIGKRLDYCIKQAASVEPPADETPLLMVYGLFDETLRLSALAMQSVALSESIARLLEKYSDEETNTAARQSQDEFKKELFDLIRKEHAATRERIDNQPRNDGERWATVPKCIDVIKDMIEYDEETGRNKKKIDSEMNTLRINIQKWLKEHEKPKKGLPKKHYYRLADLTDAAAKCYNRFPRLAYCVAFENIGIPAEEIPKPKESKKRKGV